jgi:hypothetical protein
MQEQAPGGASILTQLRAVTGGWKLLHIRKMKRFKRRVDGPLRAASHTATDYVKRTHAVLCRTSGHRRGQTGSRIAHTFQNAARSCCT